MADNELLIKINADAKNAVKAFDDVRAKTEDMDEVLKDVSKISAVAFAALTAEVGFAVHAFSEAEEASKSLAVALQNQGIFTRELVSTYKDYAKQVQNTTGIDDDAIVKSQAVAQSYLGQTVVTKALTMAIADLAASMGGDMNAAATMIGKTIGTSTNAFARQGLVLSETATQSERMAKVLEFVQQRAGGLAEAANQGIGGIKGLKAAFGDLQEAIGEKFAPLISAAIAGLRSLFKSMEGSGEVVNLSVALIAAGLAVTGILTVVPQAIIAIGALQAAFKAMQISATAGQIAIKGLIGATGIGLLVIVGVEVALHWKAIWNTIQAVTQAATQNISAALAGLGIAIAGYFSLDYNKIKLGLTQVKQAFIDAKNDFIAIGKEQTAAESAEGEKQSASKKAAADRAAAIERQHQNNLRNIRTQEIALLRLQNEGASEEMIALKTKEIETLKALNEQKSAQEKELLQARHAEIVALEQEQQSEDLGRATQFQEELSAAKKDLQAQDSEAVYELRKQDSIALQASLMTDADVERKILSDTTKARIDARNKELIDRKKHGEVIASINKFIASEEVQGTKEATSELVALQNSRNSSLKAIGKAAAVAQITIKTAESAINIYNGFSTIPIIGPALGIAGAAAAIAYGGEQIAQVTGAQQGGLIEGGIPGRDSVPAFLEPGELVVPRKNYNDVVGAVQGEGNEGFNEEAIALLQSIEAKSGTGGNTIIQGDVMADESYVDALIRKISERIEFGNAKIFGLNT